MFIGSTVFVVLDTIQSMYGARDAFGTLQEHDCSRLTRLSIAQNVVLRMMVRDGFAEAINALVKLTYRLS